MSDVFSVILMKKPQELKIALADLAYLSKDDYVQTVPLNIGYIAAYLKGEVSGINIELFKDPQKLYDAFVKAPGSYYCLALSNYDWNFNLNRHFLKMAQQRNPDLITVMGGPNIDSGSTAGFKEFFNYFPELDFYILGEGEYRFAALIKSILQNDGNLPEVWAGIPATIIGYDPKKGMILKGHREDHGFCDCQTLPSPYLTGLLDNFLNNPHLVPIIETNRGCPYGCAFCCRGNSIDAKIREFNQKTVLEELQYISLRAKNPLKALYIADNNFGILKRDLEIARAIRDLNRQDGSHKNIYMFFAKNTNEDTIKVAETLKDLTDISMSRQSLNPEVLRIIGRQNIADANYDRSLLRLNELGISTFCELIYGLPGESRESFLDGLEKMYQKEVNISVYPLLLLKGTRINSPEFREKYQIKSAFRIMSRYLGSYGDINSVEYEELLISHANLTAEDYLEIRLVVFFHVLFFERIFTELVLFFRENRLNLASFFRFLVKDRLNWPTILVDFIRDFENNTRAELINKQDLKFNFSQEEVNDIRENALDLNTYYMCKLIAARERVDYFKQYLFNVLKEFILSNSISLDTDELSSILDICFDKIPDYPDLKKRKTISYPYDLDSWLKAGDGHKLSSFKTRKKVKYLLELDKKAILLFNEQYENSKNIERNLYRIRKQFIVSQINPSRAYTYQRTQL